jgi:hypothetical protein
VTTRQPSVVVRQPGPESACGWCRPGTRHHPHASSGRLPSRRRSR